MGKNSYDYVNDFESWFNDEEFIRIKNYIFGISFYEFDVDNKFFTNAFKLITSVPKNFRIKVISTSNYDWNSVFLYLNLSRAYKLNRIEKIDNIDEKEINNIYKKITMKENINFSDLNEYEVFEYENDKEFEYKNKIKNYKINYNIPNNLYFSKYKDNIIGISLKSPKLSDFINSVEKVLSIVILNKNKKRGIVISASFAKKADNNFIYKGNIVKLFLSFVLRKKNKLNRKIEKFLNNGNIKSLFEYSFEEEKIKTSILMFFDITNSTKIIKEYPNEGLLIIRELISQVALTMERKNISIDEIRGDGIICDLNLLKLDDFDNLINIIYEIFRSYNDKKNAIIDDIKNSPKYIKNKKFYKNLLQDLKLCYFKVAITVDGIYFFPIENISFKQSVLFGTELWTFTKIFNNPLIKHKKDNGDIFVLQKKVFFYKEVFL